MTTDNDSALSRRVAEVAYQGWTVVKTNAYWEVKNPSGELKRTYPSHWLEESIWRSLKGLYDMVATDANAAAEVAKVDGYVLHLATTVDGWKAYYVPVTISVYVTIYGHRIASTEQEGLMVAEAICRARLALAEYLEVNRE